MEFSKRASRRTFKWVADVGSKVFGGVDVSGGKVFIGTNNERPRNPAVNGDKGILMCFDEKTGQFLWQALTAHYG